MEEWSDIDKLVEEDIVDRGVHSLKIGINDFKEKTNINQAIINKIKNFDDSFLDGKGKIFPLQLIVILVKAAKDARMLGKEATMQTKEAPLEEGIKEQKYIKEVIDNQTKLGNLMFKPEMAKRVKGLLHFIQQMMFNQIKDFSKVIGDKYKINSRELLENLVHNYNKNIDELKEKMHMLSWGEDGNVEILLNRIATLDEVNDFASKKEEDFYED